MTSASPPKLYLSADRLLADSFRLANLVHDSGFRPSHIVGIWRGGAPVGIAVQELLEYRGVHSDHIAIRTASYTGIDQQEPQVRIYGLGHLVDVLNPEDRLLLIDACSTQGARSARSSPNCASGAAGTCPTTSGSQRSITSRRGT